MKNKITHKKMSQEILFANTISLIVLCKIKVIGKHVNYPPTA